MLGLVGDGFFELTPFRLAHENTFAALLCQKLTSMPKPVLQAMVLADHVYRDMATGKHIICGTFTHFWHVKQNAEPAEDAEDGGKRQRLKGPISRAGTPYLYIALVEVHGNVPLELKFVDLSDASVLFEGQLTVASRDPIAISEYVMPMPPHIQPAKVGNYSLDLLHENEILGSWRINVSEFGEQTKETGTE